MGIWKVKTVSASIHFLMRNPEYLETKPYAFQYKLENTGIGQTNMEMEEVQNVEVMDMRSCKHRFTFESHGFETITLQSHLSHEDFAQEDKLSVYFHELEGLLKQRLGASSVKIFRHGIRKRYASFPISTGAAYHYDQPTSVAHIDTTPEEMLNEVERQFGAVKKGQGVEWINVWKPLRGPLNDWPLTLCDASSVDHRSDLETADLLYPDLATENFQVYHNQKHRWYYLSDHSADEIIVSRQASTLHRELSGKHPVTVL